MICRFEIRAANRGPIAIYERINPSIWWVLKTWWRFRNWKPAS